MELNSRCIFIKVTFTGVPRTKAVAHMVLFQLQREVFTPLRTKLGWNRHLTTVAQAEREIVLLQQKCDLCSPGPPQVPLASGSSFVSIDCLCPRWWENCILKVQARKMTTGKI